MTEALWQATRALRDRDDLRVLVIRAEGEYFTAGIDLGAVPGEVGGARPESDIRYRRLYRDHHLLYDEMEAVEKPVILAAQGPCLGAGVEMAVSCDFRFAAQSARFQLPEIGLGVIPGSGGTGRLTRLLGPHWAKWMAMAGRSLTAEQALAVGWSTTSSPTTTSTRPSRHSLVSSSRSRPRRSGRPSSPSTCAPTSIARGSGISSGSSTRG
jgi:enoyl-CoA hydratase